MDLRETAQEEDAGTEEIIMVVDDNYNNLRLLSGMLMEKGYLVKSAISGAFALQSVQVTLPDLILLDIKMPEIDGYEVCRQLKIDERTRDIQVIFISAMEEIKDKVKAFAVGGVDYITKPFQHDEVIARVATHMAICHMQKRIKNQNARLEIEIIERKKAQEELGNANEALKHNALELEEANRNLQEADRLKTIFLAGMSHELRTPLNSIIGFTGIMLQGMSGEINEEQEKQLKMVESSANHLLGLINDLLDVAKIEAGRVEPSIEEFVLDDIIEEIKEIFLPTMKEKNLEFKTNVQEGIILKTDKRRVKQVLMNFLSNAVKFTDHGNIRITVKMPGNEKVEINIADTGIGIKEEDMDKLFQPFLQIPISIIKRHEGTGLGLHLSWKLADLLGGSVSAKSDSGKGSEFTFMLPLRARAKS